MNNDTQTAETENAESTDEDEPQTHAFWAATAADEIEETDPTDPIVIKGGVSPSGVAHLGNFNEVMRGYYIAEVLRERGHEVRQVFTSDDRDPLRSLPQRLADDTGEIVGLGDVDAGALGRNLGRPYTDIPDPFGESKSYAAHFTKLLAADADRLDIPVEIISNTEYYQEGKFEESIKCILEDIDTAREVLSEYQSKVDEDYVPFNPLCQNCGKITETVTDIDLDAQTVTYHCTDMTAGERAIEGCGHEGVATFREGKLPWRFEWPAQWQILDVDFEPFGKDHAEGSWPSGTDIAENVLDTVPPIPMVYEWFTVNDESLSSSTGNIVTVTELLTLLEPAVIRYFFALDPRRARDLDLENLDQLVDDFDRFERAYFDGVNDESINEFAEQAYPYVVENIDSERVRLPYTFAAVLGMTDDRSLQIEMARNEGHIDAETPEWAVTDALNRIEKARIWAERMDNTYNYQLQETQPAIDIDPTSDTAKALDTLAEVVAEGSDGEEIQEAIFDIARDYDIPVGEFFEVGYQLFFNQSAGPRLGKFLGELDAEFVVQRLRREG
ncbi:lysine--tRNA ligase [Haloquadratum walsbyi]|jgi:lysyl-tRNA synthetase class 1|uniref:Lysine--tRNA ligase n=1 Tax=Haloquadratum walsbyi (strain DSM 16790 / HBSQ001) TaxID=362976 RepID=Q18DR2_HALWD|nr:lysine--tRNA ligase [Haloquadratum walsbyi]CAJ51227.1 lysine--tRNA ligase [Haloquadratum walsbyi DSM 16790]